MDNDGFADFSQVFEKITTKINSPIRWLPAMPLPSSEEFVDENDIPDDIDMADILWTLAICCVLPNIPRLSLAASWPSTKFFDS